MEGGVWWSENLGEDEESATTSKYRRYQAPGNEESRPKRCFGDIERLHYPPLPIT